MPGAAARAVIDYDPAVIAVERIKKMIEAPVRLENGSVVRPFTVREIHP